MQATFKIQVNKLTTAFIKDIKEKYSEAELEITVNPKPGFTPLKEEDFWAIIGLLDWKKENDNEILQPAIEKLSSLPIAYIYNFEDLLSEKLYQLDQKKIAENIGKNAFKEGKYFSVDSFLYARACVIANGKDAFLKVLSKSRSMPKNITFEPLLSLASKAYFIKTGNEFIYTPLYNYETYANKKGWEISIDIIDLE